MKSGKVLKSFISRLLGDTVSNLHFFGNSIWLFALVLELKCIGAVRVSFVVDSERVDSVIANKK